MKNSSSGNFCLVDRGGLSGRVSFLVSAAEQNRARTPTDPAETPHYSSRSTQSKPKKNRKSLEYYYKDLIKVEQRLINVVLKYRELEVKLLVTELKSGLEINYAAIYAPQTRTIMMTEIVKPKMTMIGQQFGPYKYQSFPISSVEIF